MHETSSDNSSKPNQNEYFTFSAFLVDVLLDIVILLLYHNSSRHSNVSLYPAVSSTGRWLT